MEALKILEHTDKVNWEYDEEADVLYLSVGKPRPATGVNIGEGVVLRYTEPLTLIEQTRVLPVLHSTSGMPGKGY
jgi:hypothetical protein